MFPPAVMHSEFPYVRSKPNKFEKLEMMKGWINSAQQQINLLFMSLLMAS